MSYAASSSSLEIDDLPTLSHTNPMEHAIAPAIAEFMALYDWDNVYVLYSSDFGTVLADAVVTACKNTNNASAYIVSFDAGLAYSLDLAIDSLADLDARVTMILADDDDLDNIVGALEQHNMLGAQRVYLFTDSMSAEAIVDQGEALAGAARISVDMVPPIAAARWARFTDHWRGLSEADFNFTASAGPYAALEAGYFSDTEPVLEAALAVDAVAVAGLSACSTYVASETQDRDVDIAYFMESLKNLTVERGMSGSLAFDEHAKRSTSTTYFRLESRRAGAAADAPMETLGHWSKDTGWEGDAHVFADGTTDAPADSVEVCNDVTYWSDDAGACLECGVGYERNKEDHYYSRTEQCVACAPGRYRSADLDSCQRCDTYSYQPDYNASSCIPCGARSMRTPEEVSQIYIYIPGDKKTTEIESILDGYASLAESCRCKAGDCADPPCTASYFYTNLERYIRGTSTCDEVACNERKAGTGTYTTDSPHVYTTYNNGMVDNYLSNVTSFTTDDHHVEDGEERTVATCQACPSGAICNGGWDRPFPAHGYNAKIHRVSRRKLREDDRRMIFRECRLWNGLCTEEVKNEIENACSRTRQPRSLMCQQQRRGYTNVGGKFEFRCLDGSYGILQQLALIATVVVCFVYVSKWSLDFSSVGLLLEHMRVLALLFSVPIPWPKNPFLQTVGLVFEGSQFDVDLAPPLCLIPKWGFGARISTQILLVVLMCGIAIVQFLVKVLRKRGEKLSEEELAEWHGRAEARLSDSCLVAFLASYPTLAEVALGVFRCTEFGEGQYHLYADLRIRCFSSSQHKALMGLSMLVLAALAAAPIGTSMFFARSIRKNELRDPAMTARFSCLLDGIKPECVIWYQSNSLLRLFLLSVVVTFCPSRGYAFCLFGLLLIVIVSTAVSCAFCPHVHRNENCLELLLLLTSLVTLASATIFVSHGDTPNKRDQETNVFVVNMLNILIVTCMGLAGYIVASDVRKETAQRAASLRLRELLLNRGSCALERAPSPTDRVVRLALQASTLVKTGDTRGMAAKGLRDCESLVKGAATGLRATLSVGSLGSLLSAGEDDENDAFDSLLGVLSGKRLLWWLDDARVDDAERAAVVESLRVSSRMFDEDQDDFQNITSTYDYSVRSVLWRQLAESLPQLLDWLTCHSEPAEVAAFARIVDDLVAIKETRLAAEAAHALRLRGLAGQVSGAAGVAAAPVEIPFLVKLIAKDKRAAITQALFQGDAETRRTFLAVLASLSRSAVAPDDGPPPGLPQQGGAPEGGDGAQVDDAVRLIFAPADLAEGRSDTERAAAERELAEGKPSGPAHGCCGS